MTFKTPLTILPLIFFAATATSQAITDEEALKTGHQIETTINSGNPAFMNYFMDPDHFIENVRQKSKAMKQAAFLRGFKETFVPTLHRFGDQIAASVRGTGNYRLLKESDEKGVKHLFFRMFGSSGLNYYDFALVRVGDSIKASDVFLYTTDSWMSANTAELADLLMKSDDPEGAADMIVKMRKKLTAKDYDGIKQMYDNMDEKLKANKSLQLLYITACRQLDMTLYQHALEHYAFTFPDGGSAYLMMIDAYYLKKEYEKGMAALDKLDKVVGGDPFLDFYRAIFYLLWEKKPESKTYFENVYRYDPSITRNTVKLASIYAEAGETDKAKKVIEVYKKTETYQEKDLDALYLKYPDLKQQ